MSRQAGSSAEQRRRSCRRRCRLPLSRHEPGCGPEPLPRHQCGIGLPHAARGSPRCYASVARMPMAPESRISGMTFPSGRPGPAGGPGVRSREDGAGSVSRAVAHRARGWSAGRRAGR